MHELWGNYHLICFYFCMGNKCENSESRRKMSVVLFDCLILIYILSSTACLWTCIFCVKVLCMLRRGKGASTSLMRAMKRFPKRQGLCRLHCNELTVICWDCCTATATTCTASYISAASVCKVRQRKCGDNLYLTWYTTLNTSEWTE